MSRRKPEEERRLQLLAAGFIQLEHQWKRLEGKGSKSKGEQQRFGGSCFFELRGCRWRLLRFGAIVHPLLQRLTRPLSSSIRHLLSEPIRRQRKKGKISNDQSFANLVSNNHARTKKTFLVFLSFLLNDLDVIQSY